MLALLDLFLERAQPQQTRMRHLLQELAGEPLLEALQARLDFPLRRDERVAAWQRPPGRAWSHLGVQPQRQPGLVMVGAAARSAGSTALAWKAWPSWSNAMATAACA